MSIVRTLIGNIKGPAGATGATGATGAAGANGADGAAATVNVGTVSTTAYGNPAQVINSGTESAAVLDFVIPQGQPGEEVTDMSGLTLGTMTTQTAQYPTPQVGDNGATLWGKVVKYFSDLRTLIGTKLNTANVVNNFTTTQSGYALDARAGKTLLDSINTINTQKSTLASGDLNDVITHGTYVITSSNTYTHLPTGVTTGILCVSRSSTTSTFINQVIYNANGMYQRYGTSMGASWTDWNLWATYNAVAQSNTNQVMNQKGLGISFVRFGHYKRIRLNGTLTETLATETLLDFGDISTLAGAEYVPEFTYQGTHMLRTNARANVIMYTSNSGNYVKNHLYIRVYGSDWTSGTTFLLDVSYN